MCCWRNPRLAARNHHHRHRKDPTGLRLKRELEAGQYQWIDIPLPCVLTIQSGINKLRYATLIGIKQARNKPVKQLTLADVAGKLGTSRQKIERLYIPVKPKQTEMLQGSPGEIAKKLVEGFATRRV